MPVRGDLHRLSVVRFGLVIATNSSDDITLTPFSGASNLGSVNYVTNTSGDFIGIEELTPSLPCRSLGHLCSSPP
jgi:hypothetical protein